MDTETPRPSMPTNAEHMYDLLTRYRFARSYVEKKSVLDIGWDTVDYGTRLLADSAGSVAGVTGSPEALARAEALYPAPNVDYRQSNFPKLPYQDESFDAAVAFGVIEKLEEPEKLVIEAKRVLKEDGVLIVSTPDKQAHSNDRNHRDPANRHEMYVSELRELLERRFEHVDLFRQGSMSGGFVLPAEGGSPARVESTSLSSHPHFGDGPPESLFVLAVCSDSEAWRGSNGQPYLLLDRDRRVYEECADNREDIELLREEIYRLQKTEVQAFQDSLRLQGSEGIHLKTQLERYEAEIKHLRALVRSLREQDQQSKPLREQNHKLQERAREAEQLKNRLRAIENSRTWRLLGVYRRLMSRRKP